MTAMELKLAKLPDRIPVKITISVKPDLHTMLRCYAEFYRQSYGEEESISELIPYMLQTFMDADRGFAKSLKNGGAIEDDHASSSPLRRSHEVASNSETSS
jgi:hypothetical protein